MNKKKTYSFTLLNGSFFSARDFALAWNGMKYAKGLE